MKLSYFKRLLGLRASPRLFAAYDIYMLTTARPFSRQFAFDVAMQNTRCVDRALKVLVDSGLLEITENPRRYVKQDVDNSVWQQRKETDCVKCSRYV